MEELIRLYIDMIEKIENSKLNTRGENLTCLFNMKGNLYNGDIMIVGRAVNGWDDAFWKHGDLRDRNTIRKHVQKIMSISENLTECPLNWVNESWGRVEYDEKGKVKYNSKKSAFWRLVNKIVSKIANEEFWWSKIVWTNIYKIAPDEGGNPKNKLIDIQYENCVKILSAEIELYKPKHIVFFTGLDWVKPFVKDIEKITLSSNKVNSLVEAIGNYNFNDGKKANIIIAKHPQGKPEEKMLEEILNYW